MPDKSFQTDLKNNYCKLYCAFLIIVFFFTSLLGLLVGQFVIIEKSIKDMPVFLKSGNDLFINTNNFIIKNEPIIENILKGILLNSVQFNKTLLNIDESIDIIHPRILGLINYTENQLTKIDVLLNKNFNQLIEIDNSINKILINKEISTAESSENVPNIAPSSIPTDIDP
jgi:hypothetical protein